MKSAFTSTTIVARKNQLECQPRSQSRGLRYAIIATGLLLAGFGGFHAYRPSAHQSDPATPNNAVSRHAATAARIKHSATRTHQWQWPAEARCTYQIKRSLDLAAGNADIAPDACGLTEIEGKLNVCLLESDAQGVTLAMQLSDVAVMVDPAGAEPVHHEPVIENMLNSSPGLLHLDLNGHIVSYELPAALADQDRVMLQGLFATEFVLGNGSHWEAGETAQGLSSRSIYQEEANGRFSKTRQALPSPQGQPSLRIVESRFSATPGSFWIESLEGSEQVECVWKDRIVCTANTTVKVDRLEETTIPESLAAIMADPGKRNALIDSASLESGDEAHKTSARERQELARLVEKYQTVPADRMIADLVGAVANAKGHEDTIPAMHALRDWLLANPEHSSEIADALKKSELPDAVNARIVHALELAGRKSAESQSALASILSAAPGTYPLAVQMQAAVAAGGVGRVLSPELLSALSDMASAENPSADYRLSDAALYAMGSLARENPELQQSLVDTLSSWLDKSGNTSAEDTATALRTLANARNQDPTIMAKALALSSSAVDVDVRMAAIDFFATSDQPEALQAISRSLARDPSENVRRQAVEALTRPERISSETLRPVLNLIANANTPAPIKEFAIANLVPHEADFPEIRQALQRQQPSAQGASTGMSHTDLSKNP